MKELRFSGARKLPQDSRITSVWYCNVFPVEPLLLKSWWQACLWQSQANKQTYNAWNIPILRKLLFIWNPDKLSVLYFIYQNSLRLQEPALLVNWNIWINICHWLCPQSKISLDRCVKFCCCCLFVCFVLFCFGSRVWVPEIEQKLEN